MKNFAKYILGLTLFFVGIGLVGIQVAQVVGVEVIPEVSGVVYASLIGSIAASVAGTFNTQYLPQFIGFTASTVPTNFQIEINGRGQVFSLDGNGLSGMNAIRMVARNANQYIYQLADGLLNGLNCTFSITNAVASQLDIYGWSPVKRGSIFCTYQKAVALAGVSTPFRKFAYASFPAAAATDKWTIAYKNGSIDSNLTRNELNFNIGYTQGLISSVYNIDNISPATIDNVEFSAVAQQNFYVMKYQNANAQVAQNVV